MRASVFFRGTGVDAPEVAVDLRPSTVLSAAASSWSSVSGAGSLRPPFVSFGHSPFSAARQSRRMPAERSEPERRLLSLSAVGSAANQVTRVLELWKGSSYGSR